jgi:hypothetical protein
LVIVELRQYTLHPGQRDVLIDLFDRDFIEPQERAGMTLIGQFRVLGDDDRFFWLRGFPDMTSRAAGLAAFYGGPVWAARRDAANATMIDSDNVLLLRPARTTSGFGLPPRSAAPENGGAGRLYVAQIYYFDEAFELSYVPVFEELFAPNVTDAGASVCGYFVTERSKNNFPALPIREDEHVFAWFGAFADPLAYEDCTRKLEATPVWRSAFQPFANRLRRPVEVRKLIPTAGSRLR